MEGAHPSFVIRATYDLLPSPRNLKEWYGEDPACSLCQVPASLRHILSGCTTSLTQGRYTWRDNQVLRELASILEQKRSITNNLTQTLAGPVNFTNFVPAGQHQEHRTTPKDASILQSARDWKLEVDIDKKLVFPPEIVATTLQPDMVLWSPTTNLAYVVELTVPWEEGVEEANERKNYISTWQLKHHRTAGRQGICWNIYHQFAGKNRGEGSLSPTCHQVHIKCC